MVRYGRRSSENWRTDAGLRTGELGDGRVSGRCTRFGSCASRREQKEAGTTTTYKRRECKERRGTRMRANAATSRARARGKEMEVG